MLLITGGAGYIGSHTCKALKRAGFNSICYDNLSTGFRQNVKWGQLIVGDVNDPVALRKVFRNNTITGVLHFAASAYVGESVKNPLDYYRNNVASTVNLLETIVDHQCPPLVFSSSCATYGNPQTTPIHLNHPQKPVNPYGWTKLMGEQIILDACAAHGLRAGILRYFNAAGADPDGELREEHTPETHLIPLAIDAALGNTGPLQVFGSDYPTSDGTCVRDYIHVSDLAEAHVKAMQLLQTGSAGFIKNLGTGSGYSVKKILDAVERITGLPVPHQYVSRRAGDPPTLEADVDPSDAALFQYSDLDTIVRTAWTSRR